MDGSGRISKRNRQFLKKILPFKSSIAPSVPENVSVQVPNNIYSGPTAVQAGRPSFTASNTEPAVVKSTPNQLPRPDTLDQEINMSDDDFDAGLTQAVYHVLNDGGYSKVAGKRTAEYRQ